MSEGTKRELRTEFVEIVKVIQLKRGELPNIRWNEAGRHFEVEIAKRLSGTHNKP